MNNSIVESLNKRLTQNDTLYILGDLCNGSKASCNTARMCLNTLKTKNVIVISGNHDSIKFLDELKNENIIRNWYRWRSVDDIVDGEVVSIALFHHPTIDYHNERNPIMCFHGHSHGLLPITIPDLFDVSWDRHKKCKTAQEILNTRYNTLEEYCDTHKQTYAF